MVTTATNTARSARKDPVMTRSRPLTVASTSAIHAAPTARYTIVNSIGQLVWW
jgi:hypothetical protein